jgi:DNA-binding response OmpR family regulator
MKKKVLIIEDDRALLETTAAYLESEGFEVRTAAEGDQGLMTASEGKSDLIVLDLVLPGKSGLEICKILRDKGIGTPIIMLTGKKKDEIDRVMGLELGADDYLLKPFSQRELLARIKAVIRRSQPEPKELVEYSFGDVRINFKKKIASRGNKEIYLTAKEYDLLRLLISHEGEVVSRDTMLNEVWGYDKYPTTRTVDTFIHSLRRKIEKDPANPGHLLTIPWSGYKFRK